MQHIEQSCSHQPGASCSFFFARVHVVLRQISITAVSPAQENACIRLSVRFGARGYAMEVENKVRPARVGETSVMGNRLYSVFIKRLI